ncbi:hypothetical protein [Williamsia sp. CHRR-6]|uniref:hypothetical protein n=1 Tax=Williamsia sp. CHRR-6 TaxID=2835871 RepID=UPI001BDABAEC|nr:hypothetical protein [Williamsia sp. CHRR-6]MBT0566524.1 hypothetical protein [Williamsia sp. CHRR-6]
MMRPPKEAPNFLATSSGVMPGPPVVWWLFSKAQTIPRSSGLSIFFLESWSASIVQRYAWLIWS